ncbi:phage tail tape measure protein [Mammaliicoccus sciuri]|uniref:phage tail tape measure protein n=1 Tax=Mammaliicoccus sciuri TaxID=1296 RepID=UPI00397D2072
MASPIGNMVIKVDLDGSGFNKGVTGLNRQMRMVSKEMSANLSKFSRYDNSLEKSKVKVDGLSKRQQVQSRITKELRQNYEKLSSETGENSAKTQAAASKYNEAKAKLNQYDRELSEATTHMKELKREQRALNSNMGKLGASFSKFGPKVKGVGDGMKNVGRSMSMYITAPVVAGFGLSIKKAADFEGQMSRVGAIAGSSKKELKSMSDQAIELGAKTSLSAQEVASGMEELAAMGFSAKQIMGAMPGVISAAEASGADMATTSKVMASSINAFGLKASDASHVADVLAEVANRSSADINDMGYAMKYAGTPAKALGASLEETSAAIGIMTDAGLDGSQAGTSLRGALIRLSKPSEKASKQMEKLGIHLEDSKGKFVGMPNLIGQFNKELKGMSKAEKLANIAGIVGTESASGFLALMEAGPKKMSKFTKSLEDSDGASAKAAKRMKDNLKGSLEQLGGAFESLGIIIGNMFSPILRKLADSISWVVEKLNGMPRGIQIALVSLTALAAAIGPIVFAFGTFISVIGSAMTTLGPLLIGISKAGGVMAFLSGKVATLVKLFPALGPAITFAGGPLLWIVGGLTALGIAFTVAYKKSETFRNIVNKAVTGVMNVFKAAKIALQGFFQLFKGNGQDGVITLSKIFPPDIVVGITNFANKVKATFFQVINAIKGFATQIGNQLSTFWKQNGTQITQAVKNIGQVIGTVFSTIWNFVIKPIMTLIWNLMKVIWPGIKWLVKSVWDNIKGVISGALNVIMGVIKVFAGLFTGDFRKMWEGIKQIFKGALQLIWNGIQLMLVGKILGAGKVFIQLFKSLISGGWKFIVNVFKNSLASVYRTVTGGFSKVFSFSKKIITNLRNTINKLFDSMRNGIIKSVKSIYTNIRSAFTKSFNSSKNIFSKLRDFTVNLWKRLRDAISNIALKLYVSVKNSFTRLYDKSINIFKRLRKYLNDVWTTIRKNTVDKVVSLYKGVKNHFEKLFSSSKSINQRLRDFMSNIWRGIKDKTTGMARNIKDAVLGSFRSMRDKLKGIVGKIKDHIGGMVKGVKKGLNKLIDGVNAVATKIGMDKFKKIKLSTGTVKHNHSLSDSQGRLKQHTRAIVGDKGPGNGPGGFRHEMIEYPNGRLAMTPKTDTEVILPKGSRVHNGTATYNYLNTPQFSTGTLPRFSLGSWLDDKKKDAGKYAGKKMAQANNAGKQIINGTKDTAKALKKGFDKAIGDVWDFASNPGKLVDKVMSHFGVDFGSLPELPRKMMAGMYKKLKEGVKDLFGGWLEDSGGGDGSSFTKYAITTPYSPNKAVAGYGFNGGRHYGIDYATPVGTTLTAPTSGTISKLSNYGGGTVAKLLSGKFTQFFMHLKDIFKTGKVKQGEKFAHTGNSGHWTTGPHLHYQVEKGHSADITNRNTVDPAKFLSGKSGGKQAPSQWRSTIQRAARRMKVNLSSKELNGIIAQIQRESGGDASVTQGNIGDINNLRGTPAQGLLQYVPSTFKAYAMKGHGNIKSGYDQLLAFFNNSNWRRNLPYGRSGWGPTGSRRFATGGKVWNGFYHLGEEGYPEWIIPSDPKRSEDSWKLLALAANDLEKNSPKSKRPNNLPNPSTGSGSSNSNLEKKFDMLLSLVSKLVSSNEAIANKDYEPVIDKYSLESEVFKLIEKYERTKSRKNRYNLAT